MKEKDCEVKVLDELNKGACMGMDAIEFIIPKVVDNDLKKELKHQYDEYENISKEINKIYPKHSNKKPHETSELDHMMTFCGIEKSTMMDATTSKIAELLIQGTNMGIIEGRRLLNNNDINPKINALIDEYVTMQEKAVENLKPFL